MSTKLSYPKHEKLKSRKRIAELFTEGNVVKAYPIRIHYLISPRNEEKSNIQVGVSVSKRNFKKAPDRNKIKRQLREAYRLHQQLIKEVLAIGDERILSMMIIYGSKEFLGQETINAKITKAFKKLGDTINDKGV